MECRGAVQIRQIDAAFFAKQKNRQQLSLNSIEESQEENILKSIYSNVIISLISYLFTMLNEKPEAASKKILRYFLRSKKTGSINHYCHPVFLKNFYITF